MEIREGMFVRTKDGEIHKCLDIHIDENNKKLNRFMNEYGNIIMFDEIKKAEEELPKLLEKGDFVDTHLISVIKDRTIFFTDGFFIDFDDVEDLAYQIVTKEQFESIGYKIEGE